MITTTYEARLLAANHDLSEVLALLARPKAIAEATCALIERADMGGYQEVMAELCDALHDEIGKVRHAVRQALARASE